MPLKRSGRGEALDELLELLEGLGLDGLALRRAGGAPGAVEVDRERHDARLLGELHAFDDVLVEARLEAHDGLEAERLEGSAAFFKDGERIADAVGHGAERARLPCSRRRWRSRIPFR